MAGIYIVIADVSNVQFQKYTTARKQDYIDEGNEEIEDLAKRLGVEIEEISSPIHYKIKRYAQNYVLSRFAEDLIGTNNTPIGEGDIYKDMFERSRYLMQDSRPDITPTMFNGDDETPTNRAVSWQVIHRA